MTMTEEGDADDGKEKGTMTMTEEGDDDDGR